MRIFTAQEWMDAGFSEATQVFFSDNIEPKKCWRKDFENFSIYILSSQVLLDPIKGYISYAAIMTSPVFPDAASIMVSVTTTPQKIAEQAPEFFQELLANLN